MSAPLGNQNAKKGRVSVEALRMELARINKDEDRDALRSMWRKQIEKAEEGDLMAFREINDRLDGKPSQAIVGDDENPINLIHRIERVIVNSENTDS